MRVLLCTLDGIPIALRAEEIAKMAARENPPEGMTVISTCELLQDDRSSYRSLDRKLIMLKDHPDTALEITDPKDIIEIDDEYIKPLPDLILRLEKTPCIQNILVYEEQSYCLIDSAVLIREHTDHKETL